MSAAELIARLEAATGPDRELDAAIALAVGYTTYPDGYGEGNEWVDPNGNHLPRAVRLGAQPPKFTASIDSALTLVPDGWAYEARQGPSGFPHIWDLLTIKTGDVRYTRVTGRAKSAALAICIAALKARRA